MHLLVLTMLLFSIGCKKDKNSSGNPTGTYSFANSEYTGLARVGNHYFARPLSIRFGAGNEVSAWSHLTLTQWRRGEIKGTITKVEEDAQGQTQVTVLFDLPGDEQFNSPQVYTISADKSTITGGTSPIIAMVDMKLYPKTSYSIVGTWAQPAHPDWFPDVNTIRFNSQPATTNYIQSGKYIYYSYDDGVYWAENYKQEGSRIIFVGINPTVAAPLITSIPYYGVISADGKTLYVDAYDFAGARITTSLSTFEWYGPKGATPWLQRQ